MLYLVTASAIASASRKSLLQRRMMVFTDAEGHTTRWRVGRQQRNARTSLMSVSFAREHFYWEQYRGMSDVV